MSNDLTSPAIFVRDVADGLNRYPGQANGLATLDSLGMVPTTQLPASIYYYQGTWNAATDTPHLAGTTPTIGFAWSVSVAGTTTLGAISSWSVGDFAVYGAAGWTKIPSGGVLTFNSRSGAVVPVAGDYDGLSLDLGSAGYLVVPTGAAAAPTAAGRVAFDSTGKHLHVGDGTSSLTVLDSSSIGVTVQQYDAALSALAAAGSITTGDILAAPAGVPAWSSLSEAGVQATAAILDAIVALSAAGLVARTGPGTVAARTITGTANRITVSNGDGVSGNPTLDVGANVYVAGGTDVAVADGGTGASTAAAARDNIVWSGAGAIDPSSPYTVAAGVDNVTLATSKTVAPRALSNYADGQIIRVTNSGASTITVTITPADGTIDGSSSVALTVLAHGVVGCQRVSASAWVSLQPGGLSYGSRLKFYVSGGTAYAQKQIATNAALTTWVDFGSPVAADSVTATLSGSTITVASGASTGSPSAAFYVAWKIDGTGGLALDWTAQGTVLGAQYTGMPSQTHGFAGVGWWTSTPGAGVLQFAGLQEEGATDQFIRTSGNNIWTNSGSLSSLVSVRMVNSVMSTSFQAALINGEYGGGSVFAATISSSTGSLSGLQVGFIVGRNGTTAGTATTTPVAYVSGGSVV